MDHSLFTTINRIYFAADVLSAAGFLILAGVAAYSVGIGASSLITTALIAGAVLMAVLRVWQAVRSLHGDRRS